MRRQRERERERGRDLSVPLPVVRVLRLLFPPRPGTVQQRGLQGFGHVLLLLADARGAVASRRAGAGHTAVLKFVTFVRAVS